MSLIVFGPRVEIGESEIAQQLLNQQVGQISELKGTVSDARFLLHRPGKLENPFLL
jgi:hypothetical protein